MRNIMFLTVNGKQHETPDDITVGDLLDSFDLAPLRVAVELNRELVVRQSFADTRLHDGDKVEIVTLVGGG